MANWYLSSVGWTAVSAWATGSKIVGQLVRQTAPAVNSERVFICIIAGNSSGSQPTWVITKGARTTDGTVTWQECSGNAAVNGDRTSLLQSSEMRSQNPGLGRIIFDNTRTHLHICSVAGTTANLAGQPTFNTTLGGTTTDGAATWTNIGTSFANWAAPHARITSAAQGWPVAGDDIFVADNHNEETSAAINFSVTSNVAGPTSFWCIDRNCALPATGADLRSDPYGETPACARVTTNGNFSITIAGLGVNMYGIAFIAGVGGTNSVGVPVLNYRGRTKRCSFRTMTNNIGAMTLPNGEMIDCTIAVNSTQSSVRGYSPGRLRWFGATGYTVLAHTGFAPSVLVTGNNSNELVLDGLDLRNLASGTIFGGGSGTGRGILLNCKLHPSTTAAIVPTDRGMTIDVISSDGEGDSFQTLRQERYRYEGTQKARIDIYRSGGSNDGTTPFSWDIVTSANAKWVNPFESMPLMMWNDTIDVPVTVTIYGLWLGGLAPYIDEIWTEMGYLSDPLAPFATTIDNTKANYFVPQGPTHPLEDETEWFGGEGATAFSLPLTVTPRQRGYLTVRVNVARPSTSYWIDRRLVLS